MTPAIAVRHAISFGWRTPERLQWAHLDRTSSQPPGVSAAIFAGQAADEISTQTNDSPVRDYRERTLMGLNGRQSERRCTVPS